MTESRRSARLSATDWVDAAFSLVTSEAGGVHGVTIARLCTTLGVTKGSFYWHFRDLDALWEAMAARWQEMNRRRVADLDELSEVPPEGRLIALSTMLVSRDHLTVERAIRNWARSNDTVAETVRNIDTEIFEAVEAILREFEMSPVQARLLSGVLVYAGIGYIHGHEGLPTISPDDIQRALPGLLSLTVAEPPADPDAPGPGVH
ncbi:TetR/AcrR family transcriptional regulator [Gordonia amicalis]|uniref:TetR/AcrR family transcriptional regulator n=1 Tax=Gordonia amicalis TaxID=89053 RepID=UPI001FB60B87|nr:TetR/AcrR family transcriptional regulator [Gordonia amicalis]MCZ0914230.1 TetR/AcrR family transcriptional regulator [Gordonia amicalis]UOG22775.1 TetR/AcrR family transcriptional regulator [Gordonia amicalis]